MGSLRSSAVSLVVFYVVPVSLSSAAVIFRFMSIHILRREIKAHDIFCVFSLVSHTRICSVQCPSAKLIKSGVSGCVRHRHFDRYERIVLHNTVVVDLAGTLDGGIGTHINQVTLPQLTIGLKVCFHPIPVILYTLKGSRMNTTHIHFSLAHTIDNAPSKPRHTR